MSIPLVQNNDKDAINTSIIAIKRNIERINMLLGLSNSEEIDTSKFATKEELQQAVTDLQPVDEVALNNMHSVTSNAVAESLSYSTTEQLTGGVWIDGKPIYRKVFSGNSSSSGGDIGQISNIDRVIKAFAMIKNQADGNWLTNNYAGSVYLLILSNGTVNLNGGNYNYQMYNAVIEYTKTTD